MKRTVFALAVGLALGGCGTAARMIGVVKPEEPFIGPKTIAVFGDESAVVETVEIALRRSGFKIKRGLSLELALQRRDPGFRYVLQLKSRTGDRCGDGGFMFDYFKVELVDVLTADVVYSANTHGYTEGCSPKHGKVFSEITDVLVDNWREQRQVAEPAKSEQGI